MLMNQWLARWFKHIPESLILVIGRFSISAVFWLSGQTKVSGLSIDIISGTFQLGWPHITPQTIFLFQHEYALPLLPPFLAAVLAVIAEHVCAILLLIGWQTRLAAFILAGMTLVIEIFVYPLAYPTHGVWLTVLLLLMVKGGGYLSVDERLKRSTV
ncbi:MAG: hypothetical protein CENE_02447 [Candidatus Celerinatantimonas neptuna]|nr:MAG: hypothetical protein CENE_02447 [Candidatus Celerinatantimonas neptuna]